MMPLDRRAVVFIVSFACSLPVVVWLVERRWPRGEDATSAASLTVLSPWPPKVGSPYPDLGLRDLDGKAVKLSSLKGKLLLIEPVGIMSPGSIGFAGGAGARPFEGVLPQRSVQSLQRILKSNRVSISDDGFRTVHLLFYGTKSGPPTLEQARAWASHFGLDKRANAVVLVGDRRYVRPETYAMLPGFQLVDEDFVLIADGAGRTPPDNIYDTVMPRLAAKLRGESTKLPGTTPPATPPGGQPVDPSPKVAALDPELLPPAHPDGADAAELYRHLVAGEFKELDAACARLHEKGRETGRFTASLYLAYRELLDFPGFGDHLDAWCEARPRSEYGHLLRGEHLTERAWDARGDADADDVPKEAWELFERRMRGAENEFERAVKLHPKLALAPAGLIRVGLGLGKKRMIRRGFERAIAIEPGCMIAHRRVLFPLMPQWGGDAKALLAHARGSIEEFPGEPAMHFLLVRAHYALAELAGRDSRYCRRAAVHRELEQAFRALEKSYPQSAEAWAIRSQVASRRGDNKEKLRCRRLAAQSGHDMEVYYLGLDHQEGRLGLRKNPEKAAELFRTAAARGNAWGYYSVGECYREGMGVIKNGRAAFAWYQPAAESGNPASMFRLARAFETGEGVEEDLDKALEWYTKAASAGSDLARDRLPKFRAAHPRLKR